jgi:hypothetical protein
VVEVYFVEDSIAARGEQWEEGRKEDRESDGGRDGEGERESISISMPSL